MALGDLSVVGDFRGFQPRVGQLVVDAHGKGIIAGGGVQQADGPVDPLMAVAENAGGPGIRHHREVLIHRFLVGRYGHAVIGGTKIRVNHFVTGLGGIKGNGIAIVHRLTLMRSYN